MEQTDKPVLSPRAEVGRHVLRRIERLQSGITKEKKSPDAARKLALLRRAAATDPGSAPAVFNLEFDGLRDDLVGKGDDPSKGEWAVHIALTLYAIHQQSQKEGMHCAKIEGVRKCGIGYAVKQLRALECQEQVRAGREADLGELPRRFVAMVTADSVEEFEHYARQVVHQLQAKSIAFDYGLFAGQIYEFQFSERADRVRLEWGREYAQRIPRADEPANGASE